MRPSAIAIPTLLLLATCFGAAGPAHGAPQERPAEGAPRVQGVANVERVLLDAFVSDSHGNPLIGLGPEDFVVRVDGRSVTLTAVDWVPASEPEAASPSVPDDSKPDSSDTTPQVVRPPTYPPGRLIVIFFQTDFARMRLSGQVRMAHYAASFLNTLLPTDRVAVLSFDSHLKLRQDFTKDRTRLSSAIFRCLRIDRQEPLRPEPFPSLAATFDYQAAKEAASVEQGLSVMGRALAGLGGAKTILYFGWGFRVNHAPSETRDMIEALGELARARASLFALDVTDADYHTLEVELEAVAAATGGAYEKTHLFPSQVMDRTARTISGRYVLEFERPEGPRGSHSVEVTLSRGRRAQVHARSYYVDLSD